MRTEPAEVLKDALSLSPDARAALIDSLLESLDDNRQDLEADSAAQEAWREEIHRRLHQIDSGAVQMVPWTDARSILRTRLNH